MFAKMFYLVSHCIGAVLLGLLGCYFLLYSMRGFITPANPTLDISFFDAMVSIVVGVICCVAGYKLAERFDKKGKRV